MVKLLCLFKLVDSLGCAQEALALPAGVGNVAELLLPLGQSDQKYLAAMGDGSKLQITINKKFVDVSAAIRDGDKIVSFPKGLSVAKDYLSGYHTLEQVGEYFGASSLQLAAR